MSHPVRARAARRWSPPPRGVASWARRRLDGVRGRDPRPWVRRRVPAPLREADRAAFRALASTELPVLGPWLPRLSRAADRSALWLAVAAVLAVVAGRDGRRAAVHGVVAIGATSAATNLPAKVLTGRPRPGADRVPTVRRLRRTPTSSSFPSGHTASAFAFATAVGRDVPALRWPLLTLAGGVGLSRVYTGVHYPGDVLVGAALGVAVGRATSAPWGGEDPAAARARPVADRPPLGPQGQGLVVVTNASAGAGGDPALRRQIQRRLPAAVVLDVEDGEDLPATLRRAADRAHVLGIAGGDGSANAAVAVAADRDLPVLVVPTGTLNHLARDLGISDVERAIDAAVDGRVVAVDVAVFADRPFANVASVGAYPHLVDARERLEGRVGKWPAMAWCLVKEAIGGEPVTCHLDGVPRRVWSVTVGNGRFDAGGLVPTRRRRLDEAVLEVRTVAADRRLARTRLVLATLVGRVERSSVFDQWVATTVEIRSDQPQRVARDGEADDGPSVITATIRPAALHVLQPRAESDTS